MTQGTRDVARLVISGNAVHDAGGDDNTMGIDISRGNTDATGVGGRVVHTNRTQPDATVAAVNVNLTGKFVGKTIDGPIGVIGTWTFQNTGLGNEGTLRGGFGAEAAGRTVRSPMGGVPGDTGGA